MENSLQTLDFENSAIRRVWHDEQWYYSVLDIIASLTDSVNPTDYLKKMRKRDEGLKTYMGTNCPQIAMRGKEGKKRQTIAANTEGVFRVIQSVSSPKAEPFKLWLAQAGKEKMEETENPELAIEKVRSLYQAKGYSDAWIERRVQSIETRKKLTDEWKGRGVQEGQEYSILTATIAKGTFGLTPSEHAQLKGLEKQNLRDHMTDLELIFTALGEEVTRQLTIEADAQGFEENHGVATEGGKMTGRARENLESSMKTTVVSSKNFRDLTPDTKDLPAEKLPETDSDTPSE